MISGCSLLDDLDRELERRGHRFARYADDLLILVRSRRAGVRVKTSITRYLDRALRLSVNRRILRPVSLIRPALVRPDPTKSGRGCFVEPVCPAPPGSDAIIDRYGWDDMSQEHKSLSSCLPRKPWMRWFSIAPAGFETGVANEPILRPA